MCEWSDLPNSFILSASLQKCCLPLLFYYFAMDTKA